MYDGYWYNDVTIEELLNTMKEELSGGENFLISIREDASCYDEWTRGNGEDGNGFMLYLADDKYVLAGQEDLEDAIVTFSKFSDFVKIFEDIDAIEYSWGEEFYRYDGVYQDEDDM